MTFDLGMPLVPELALLALAVLVLILGLVQQGDPRRVIGRVTFIGLLAVFGLTCFAEAGRSIVGGSFVQDGLAIFAKQLFLSSAALSVRQVKAILRGALSDTPATLKGPVISTSRR